MTNLEAIKAKITYTLSDNTYLLVLSDRGLVSTETYSIQNKRAIDLAQADAIYILCTMPHTEEGGFTVSITDRYALLNVADGIYQRYGISRKTAKWVQPW